MTEYQRIKATTQQIVRMLVKAEYAKIAYQTDNCRLKAEEISEAVSDYNGLLIMPPESAFDSLDVIEIKNKKPSQWSVNVNLWTREEGQSDLMIELTLIDNGKDILKTEIDNIHIL